ncbi:MAG: urea transporter [Bacteroidales bacterium]|nr:urea transporter [Bacteroidales bacterium]
MQYLKQAKLYSLGVLNSYTQVFFSKSLVFAILLLFVSFFDLYSGIYGLIAIITANTTGLAMGFDLAKISTGIYGFNALLVGLGLGIYFEPGDLSLFILILISIFTFLVTVMAEGVIGKYGLPFLSIPFLIGIWTVTLATREFEELIISERNILVFNELYKTGGQQLVDLYLWWKDVSLPQWIEVYLMSLGSILFQSKVIAGIIIAIGLLIYSRIAFTISIIGFYAAFIFYQKMGVEIAEISYSYIGFNYILTSIAIGSFFLVPNSRTYLWTVILVPVVAMITISTSTIFWVYKLPIYSLPFNVVVILFLYVLKLRVKPTQGLVEVPVQNYSPEKNLYTYKNNKTRFGTFNKLPIKLPFLGEWKVSQGHNGEITHKDEWQHAWDFEIEDENGKLFKNNGIKPDDFFCYNKPVLAPGHGVVEEIQDGIPDNEIGDVNLENNWGNTIIIKHAEFLYSKLSHLKSGSFKVKKGDYVSQGVVLAACGNSGRSPQPHLHFQLQATPFIGSKTISYPISHFVAKTKMGFEMQSFSIPKENQTVSNIKTNPLLKKAFHFIPGQVIKFTQNNKTEEWEVFADIYNNSYFYCKKTNSTAWFYSDNDLFYFYNFKGKKKSLLYHFYLSAYKLQKGFYKDLELIDQLPVQTFANKPLLLLQDFIAPVFVAMKTTFKIQYHKTDDENWPSIIELKSQVKSQVFSFILKKNDYTLIIDSKGVKEISCENKKKSFKAVCSE